MNIYHVERLKLMGYLSFLWHHSEHVCIGGNFFYNLGISNTPF